MMVTFVSQCEKKALNRTRRVLDAFADRIGDNTWQTVSTQEGLLAVKKLLRKTATKNTAVSCHWIRSRSRSDLVWVVGKRDKFDSRGVVPVNITQKEIPMDIIREKPVKGVDYANTHLQRLDHHLFAVGYIAEKLYQRFYPEDGKLPNAAFVAGCFHDIGKIDPTFQKWVTKDKNKDYVAEDGQHINESKFSFEKHPRHNEISVLIYELLDNTALRELNGRNKKQVKHAIYWHHAKPFRPKGGFEQYSDIYKKLDSALQGEAWQQVVEKALPTLDRVAAIDCSYRQIESSYLTFCYSQDVDEEILNTIDGKLLPTYKDYDNDCENISKYKQNAQFNAFNNQLRACLITADRWVSSLSAQELSSSIKDKTLDNFLATQLETYVIPESNLVSGIDTCLRKFSDSERTAKQAEIAQKLYDNNSRVNVLAGAAGCGKTKIALEWAKFGNVQQLLWICPRVQIAQGLFADLANDYLPDSTVELHTGEFKCINDYKNTTQEVDYFTGDIVITTIDQILNTIISHTKADRLLNYLSAHVVFDEYHEYITIPAFNLLFAELVSSRNQLANRCNALLVSATPNYLYLEELLGLDEECDVVEMPSFNPCKYQCQFIQYDETIEDHTNPLYQSQPSGTFVISNTAITAQKSFIRNQHTEQAILLHSKFKNSDKQDLFQKVFECFKRDGTMEFDLLRSGPIVQASLNISCERMVSEVCTAENHLQRLGRLDRFGENQTHTNIYVVAVPNTFHAGKRNGSLAKFMSSNNVLSSTMAWYQFLKEATDSGDKELTLPQIYTLYKQFYANPTDKKWLISDLIGSMKKSAILIADKAAEPKIIVKPKRTSKQRARISRSSLRGDSRFVQMAVCDLSEYPKIQFLEQYAYEIPTDEQQSIDSLAALCELIQGYRDSSKDLLAHMHKKHHNIMGGKKSYKDFVLLNEAVDPEFPVYLSYTTNDLLAVGGESSRHSHAVYYGTCSKQPIGSISIQQLTDNKE